MSASRLRGMLLLLSGCLLLAGTALAGEPEAAAHGALIRIEPAGFDFGAVLGGKTLRKEFRLRNVGDQDLVLQPVRTSCGCTVGKLARTTLAPGESTSLLVTLATGAARGHIVKGVVVPSNDAATPLVEIKLQATVGEASAK